MGYIGWIVVDYGEKWSIMVKSGRFGRFRSISVDFDENPGGDPWFSSIRALPIVTLSLLLWGFGFSLLFMLSGYIKGGGGGVGGEILGGGGVENSAPTHLETEKCPTSRC